ncbi:hypothetical protein Csa_010981 [Cucumis sativus]|uniref:Uncharacterized protein n=1 Tax=Cucumis sativus TaxID=3659 RepID=A0A0A0LW77_CUCSA|nr:hypothetical protein Csa_010981 [Cucumis sativus]
MKIKCRDGFQERISKLVQGRPFFIWARPSVEIIREISIRDSWARNFQYHPPPLSIPITVGSLAVGLGCKSVICASVISISRPALFLSLITKNLHELSTFLSNAVSIVLSLFHCLRCHTKLDGVVANVKSILLKIFVYHQS